MLREDLGRAQSRMLTRFGVRGCYAGQPLGSAHSKLQKVNPIPSTIHWPHITLKKNQVPGIFLPGSQSFDGLQALLSVGLPIVEFEGDGFTS